MKKKLLFLSLALALMAGAQALTPATAEAAGTCGWVCPPSSGSDDCVCCDWCCPLPGGGLTCSDRPCYC